MFRGLGFRIQGSGFRVPMMRIVASWASCSVPCSMDTESLAFRASESSTLAQALAVGCAEAFVRRSFLGIIFQNHAPLVYYRLLHSHPIVTA